jgi:hypothetical protein
VLGILATAALGFLVAHLWHHTHAAAAASSATSLTPTAPTAPGTRQPTSSATTTHTDSTTRTQTTTPAHSQPATSQATPAGVVSLLLTARADTWLEIRSGSSTGSLLYSGTLPTASSKTFRAKGLWARFGAAGNLLARVDGKLIRLPSGTYDATFDGHGFRRTGA